MKISLKTAHRFGFYFLILVLNEFLTSCTPAVSRAIAPENYNGPMAEQPVFQQGDYWIYETVVRRGRNLRDYSRTWIFHFGLAKLGAMKPRFAGPICRQPVPVLPCADRWIAL